MCRGDGDGDGFKSSGDGGGDGNKIHGAGRGLEETTWMRGGYRLRL